MDMTENSNSRIEPESCFYDRADLAQIKNKFEGFISNINIYTIVELIGLPSLSIAPKIKNPNILRIVHFKTNKNLNLPSATTIIFNRWLRCLELASF